jgi:hypothetical protein
VEVEKEMGRGVGEWGVSHPEMLHGELMGGVARPYEIGIRSISRFRQRLPRKKET